MVKTILRNLAIAYGVYIASWWVASPLALAYGKLTHAIGIHYYGEVGGKVLLPLSLTIPYALVAFGVGASVVWLVDSTHPFRWVIFPALFYLYFGIIGYHWEKQPLALDRLAQILDSSLMVIGCVGGGMRLVRRKNSSFSAGSSR
jgi:hypothetical protein